MCVRVRDMLAACVSQVTDTSWTVVVVAVVLGTAARGEGPGKDRGSRLSLADLVGPPRDGPGYVVRHFGQGGDDSDYSSEEFPPLMPYEFAYEVKDDATTNYHNRVEFVEDGILQGSYSILSPDGVVRTSVYTDSGKGFEVRYSVQ
ncbi:Larval cuticle protein A1A [Portunus trituberculatus]|uniref:Larval cuticle protein A1A n=1 Tax=Portunus trituberculatus TaxID=210409 RepID=A0A5B7GCF1_PORTR|nr:Larval cuticle protein A1A [Portunus trituberculatus]